MDIRTLVIDNGTEMIKAGFAGEDSPRAVIKSIVVRPCHRGITLERGQRDAYIGDEPLAERGIVLDSGYCVTYAVPVYEGHVLPHAISRLDLGGLDLTHHLAKFLMDGLYVFNGWGRDVDIFRDMKETIAYVALDYKQEIEKAKHFSNQLRRAISFLMEN
uniref:Actin 2 n=1 Tax=Solanum tuberosum TaxID=4113 RepID=M1BVH8_SOLTU